MAIDPSGIRWAPSALPPSDADAAALRAALASGTGAPEQNARRALALLTSDPSGKTLQSVLVDASPEQLDELGTAAARLPGGNPLVSLLQGLRPGSSDSTRSGGGWTAEGSTRLRPAARPAQTPPAAPLGAPPSRAQPPAPSAEPGPAAAKGPPADPAQATSVTAFQRILGLPELPAGADPTDLASGLSQVEGFLGLTPAAGATLEARTAAVEARLTALAGAINLLLESAKQGKGVTALAPEAFRDGLRSVASAFKLPKEGILADLAAALRGEYPARFKSTLFQLRPDLARGVAERVRSSAGNGTQTDPILQRLWRGGLSVDLLGHERRDAKGAVEEVPPFMASPRATTVGKHTLRELAATLYGVAPDKVGPAQLEALCQTNPGLAMLEAGPKGADTVVPAGQIILLSSTRAGLQVQVEELKRQQEEFDAVLAQGGLSDAERRIAEGARNQVASLLGDAKAHLSVAAAYDALGKAEVSAAPLAAAAKPEEVAKVFAAVRAQVNALPGASAHTKALALCSVAASEASALQVAGLAKLDALDPVGAIAAFDAGLQRLDAALAAPGLDAATRDSLRQQRVGLLSLKAQAEVASPALASFRAQNPTRATTRDQPLPPEVDAEFFKTESAINTSFDEAIKDAQDMEREHRDAAAKLGLDTPAGKDELAKAAACRQSQDALSTQRFSVLADLKGVINDAGGQTQNLKTLMLNAMGLTPQDYGLFDPDHEETASGGLFGGKRVGSLSPEKVSHFGELLDKLPPDKQREEVAALARYADAAGAAGDVSALKVASQLLEKAAAKFPQSACATQALFANAEYLKRVGDVTGAMDAFKHAGDPQDPKNLAGQISDPEARRYFQTRAMFGIASCEAQTARNPAGSLGGGRAAAERITKLRERLEASGPLGRDELARLTLIEMDAALGADEPDLANKALAHLAETYGQAGPKGPALPWVSAQLKSFNQDYKKPGAAAAFENAMAVSRRFSTAERLASGGSGAAIGGYIGWVGGPWGAAGGAVTGWFAGQAIYGIGKALTTGRIIDSWRTGLSSESMLSASMTLGGHVLALLPAAGLANGVRAVGVPGMEVLLGREVVEGTNAAARMAAAMQGVEKSLGTQAFKALSQTQAEAAAKQWILAQFQQATHLGGAAATAFGLGMMTAQAGTLAARAVEISRSSLSPEQKATAYQDLAAQAGEMAAQLTAFALLHRQMEGYTVNGVSDSLRDSIRVAANAKSTVVVLDDDQYRAYVLARGEAEVRALKNPTAKEIEAIRARYRGLAERCDMAFDPSYSAQTGNGGVVVSRTASLKPTFAADLAHEIRAHREFHQLSVEDRGALVSLKDKNPGEFGKIKKVVLEAMAKDKRNVRNWSPEEILDEYAAILVNDPSAYRSPVFAPAIERLGLGKTPLEQIDVETLRKTGRLELKGRYQQMTAQRQLVGNSVGNVKDLPWERGWDFETVDTHPSFEELQYTYNIRTMSEAFDDDAIRVINEGFNAIAAGKAPGALKLYKDGSAFLDAVAERYRSFRREQNPSPPYKMGAAALRAALGMEGGAATQVDLGAWFGALDFKAEPAVAAFKADLEAQLKAGKLTPAHLIGLDSVLKRLDAADVSTRLRAILIDNLRQRLSAPGTTAASAQAILAQMPGRIQTILKSFNQASKEGVDWTAFEPILQRLLAGGDVDLARFRGTVDAVREIPGMEQRLTALMQAGTPPEQLEELGRLVLIAKRMGLASDEELAKLPPGKPKLLDELMSAKGLSIELRDKLLGAGPEALAKLTENPTVQRLLQDPKLRDLVGNLVAKQVKIASTAGTPLDVDGIAARLELAERAIAAGCDRDEVYSMAMMGSYRKQINAELQHQLVSILRKSGEGGADAALRRALVAFAGGPNNLPEDLNLRDLAAKLKAQNVEPWIVQTIDAAGQRYRQVPTPPK